MTICFENLGGAWPPGYAYAMAPLQFSFSLLAQPLATSLGRPTRKRQNILGESGEKDSKNLLWELTISIKRFNVIEKRDMEQQICIIFKPLFPKKNNFKNFDGADHTTGSGQSSNCPAKSSKTCSVVRYKKLQPFCRPLTIILPSESIIWLRPRCRHMWKVKHG